MKPKKPAPKSFETQGFRLLHQLLQRGKRIFNMKDVVEAAQLEEIPHNQIYKILYNLTKHKRLLRLRRGLYVGIGLLPEQGDTHPFVISAFLIQPSTISHWSALQHHGFTEQLPQMVTASTTEKNCYPFYARKIIFSIKNETCLGN